MSCKLKNVGLFFFNFFVLNVVKKFTASTIGTSV